MYKVICRFADLKDNGHVYEVGDVYPRKGKKTTLERATELMGTSNKIGVPLIEEADIMTPPVEDKTEEKPVKKTTAKNKEK